MKNPVANGVTISQSAINNNAIESKSLIEEQDLGEKVSPHSKQHSMRKSKVSGELEREVASSIAHSLAKLPTTTPLNPVTPLRWKSTKSIEFEKKKLEEKIRTEEAVKEEMKNMKLAKEKKKDQSRMATISMTTNGIETSHKVNTPTSNHLTFQEDKMFTSFASTSKSLEMVSADEKVEDQKHSHPIIDGGSNEYAKHCEEVSSFNAIHGVDQTIGGNSGIERKPLTGDESIAITIDFLRARLLAERASSKAAKEHIQELTIKVQELEDRLDQEIQSSWKAQEEKREALMKVESLSKCKVSLPSMKDALFQHEKSKSDEQIQELNQADGKCQVPPNIEDTKPSAIVDIKLGFTQPTCLEVTDLVVSEVEAILTSEQEIGGDQCIQSSNKNGLPNVKHDGVLSTPSMASTHGDTYSPTNSKLEQQELRLCTEERLHYMWNQMAMEMSTLVEDKTIENHVREGLLKWMHQFPSVVQNILPKSFEEKKLVLETKTKNMEQKGGDVLLESLDLNQALNSKEGEDRSLDGASCGDKTEMHNKSLKKVALLIEKFEANESIQREWEESNGKHNLTSRLYSNEGSLSRMNSNLGTPLSIKLQERHHHEVIADEFSKHLLQVEDPNLYSFATNSLISPHEGMTTNNLLLRKDNGRVGTHTLGHNSPSTYPNSPIVEEKARQFGGDRIITHGTLNPNLDQTKCGSHGSMDAAFNSPRLLSQSFGPRIGEKRRDSSITFEDKSQLLKQGNHTRAFNGNCLTPESHSERSSGEIGEPTRSQVLINWVNQEDLHISPTLTNKGDPNLVQWDASIRGHHLQHERLAPYSQAGNSNAYIRPDHYPVRNDEREIYRGRMESVSRSMEGLGSSWRSLSDDEGDKTQLFPNISNVIASSSSRKFGPQMSFQANGGSRWSNYCEPKYMEGVSQNYLYPSQHFARDNFQSQSTSDKIECTSSKVNEVLKALQLAKLSIQNSNTKRSTTSSDHSYIEGDGSNMKRDYGYSDGRINNETPTTLHIWSHPEISRRYSTGSFRGAGSTTSHLHRANSVPFGMLIDAHRKYPEEKYMTRQS